MALSIAAYSRHTAPKGTERKTDMKLSPQNDHEARNRTGGFIAERDCSQAMGGRSSEPVMAGVNPEWMVSGAKRGSILAMDIGAVAGNVTECAQAQWQPAPSPRRQVFTSSADTVLTAVSANKVAGAAAVAKTNCARGPSATQIDPLTSLISNTATANTHRPRWRRR
ncbi:hypothetical protein ACFCQI_14565 [Rhodanobacter sp. FW102-FHT14D06]|uniref:Uncharacterized protein n=2 Tax=unclassified Rhodanobacter TaxID=2621553 RepID=A0AB74V138_9GAMM|nr:MULTISPECIES: hypothetical protein [Rhodanobacter]MBN8948893.1 hypothetical protein [Rhodanobacter sp.]MBQ4853648.1 hypothetical protein [Rhodanobacter sp. B2A1Ga4]UJJ52796.1 hypothetical protein LRK52_09015 [Rhodanobacter denitrificans]UJJ60477.1 hypothetical protein LRK55_18750 [Rhodanobacter denitrificans]UJM87989.1 hypothetical protein LRJ86_06745 [Rhodanobacter denitrificans]